MLALTLSSLALLPLANALVREDGVVIIPLMLGY
jgi:hypothetical protein